MKHKPPSHSTKKPELVSTTEQFERALEGRAEASYVLKLYITGSTSKSLRAIENIKNICEEQVPGSYELEIVDLYQEPERAIDNQILASPTLVRQFPLPARKYVGDLTDKERLIAGFL